MAWYNDVDANKESCWNDPEKLGISYDETMVSEIT